MVRRASFIKFTLLGALLIGVSPYGLAHLIIDVPGQKKWQETLTAPSYKPNEPGETPSAALNTLETLPSLSVKKWGGIGQISSVSFRGQTSQNTHLRIDDIPVQDPLGAINFSPLFGGATKITQIIPGSQGVRYGSGASGGVILMETPFLPSNNLLTVEGGSFQSGYTHLAHEEQTDTSRFVIHGEGSRTAGLPQYGNTRKFGEKGRSHSANLATRLEHALDDQTTLRFTARSLESTGKYDTDLTKPKGSQTTNLSLLSFGLDTQTLNTSHLVKGFLSHQKLKYENSPASSFLISGADYTGSYAFSPRLESTFLSGIQQHRIQIDHSIKKTMSTGYAGWIQKAHLTDRISGEVGIRADHHEKFGTTPTYSAIFAYAKNNTVLKAGMRTGFLNPTLYSLYLSNDFVQGNPNLKPEQTRTIDLSFEQKLPNQHLSLQLTPFWTRAKKMIHSISQNGRYQSLNASGTTTLSGLESQLSYTPLPLLKFTLNHTYTNLDFKQTNVNPEFPRHKAHVNMEYWASKALSLCPEILYIGPRHSYDGPNLKEYMVVSTSLKYQLKPGASLFARCENLFDTRYVHTHNYQTPGRSFYVGAHLYF